MFKSYRAKHFPLIVAFWSSGMIFRLGRKGRRLNSGKGPDCFLTFEVTSRQAPTPTSTGVRTELGVVIQDPA